MVFCAGVWRRKTIETAGGWNSRTTVEDMDLSLRAYMAGWKAIDYPGVRADYLDWVGVRDKRYPLPPVDLAGRRA